MEGNGKENVKEIDGSEKPHQSIFRSAMRNSLYTRRTQRQRSSLTVILYEIWERGHNGFSPVLFSRR